MRLTFGLAAGCLIPFGAALLGSVAAAETAAPAAPGGTVILNTSKRVTDPATIWRYDETWQSDVVNVDGKLLRVNIYDAREKAGDEGGKPAWKIKEARRVSGSPFPPSTSGRSFPGSRRGRTSSPA